MKPIKFSLLHLMCLVTIVAAVVGMTIQSSRVSRKIAEVEKRLATTEGILNSVAMPRYPNARVVVTMPDGRQGGGPLLRSVSDGLEVHERRTMNHWSGPAEWGVATSGGYFWRYIGSEGDRDLYEFVLVFGKRLPAEPDERAKPAFVRYVSFRNAPVHVITENGFSIALAP